MTVPVRCQRCPRPAVYAVATSAGTVRVCSRHGRELAAHLRDAGGMVQVGRTLVRVEVPAGLGGAR